MVAKMFQLPWLAFRDGHIYGVPVTRDPIAWIPYFVMLPFLLVVWIGLQALFILAMPFFIIGHYFSSRSFCRKAAVFSDAGIYFPTAYRRRTIPWSDVREVVFEIDYKIAFYRIDCVGSPKNAEGHIMAWTQDDLAFQRALAQRNIPFRIHDWRNWSEPQASE